MNIGNIHVRKDRINDRPNSKSNIVATGISCFHINFLIGSIVLEYILSSLQPLLSSRSLLYSTQLTYHLKGEETVLICLHHELIKVSNIPRQ